MRSVLYLYTLFYFLSAAVRCFAPIQLPQRCLWLVRLGHADPLSLDPFFQWKEEKPEYVEDKDLALSHDWDRKVGENMTSFVIASFFQKYKFYAKREHG